MSRPVKSTDLINWKTGFYLLLLLQGLVVLSTFTAYGITNDKPIHALYGTYLVRWYASLFQDGILFALKNVPLYGGLFETLAQLAVRLSPLDPYETRHLCNSLVGLLSVVATYRLGSALGTPATGFLAALCLILTPRYYGHSFNNPKDIPFAVGYIWTLHYMVQGLSRLPHLPSSQIWKTGLAMGLTLSIRIGGLVLAPYWVLFYGFRYLQLMGLKPDLHLARRFLRQSLAVFAIAYGTMFLFWPLAQVDPIHGPLQALNTFSQFPETHYSFFQGDYILSNTVPWYYAPLWLLLTLPEIAFWGLAAGALLRFKTWGLGHALVAFGAGFPIGYVIFSHSPLYDGIRHLLFVIPPLMVLTAVGITERTEQIQNTWIRRAFMFITGLILALTLQDMVQLHPNQYVYFNRLIAGGIGKASKKYETDYWRHSYKQGIRWIETTIAKPTDRKLRLSSLHPNLERQLDPDQFEFAHPPERADLYLGTTRFDEHRLIPGEIVHTIRANNVPLLYIIRPDSSYANDPFFSDSPFRNIYLDYLNRTRKDEPSAKNRP